MADRIAPDTKATETDRIIKRDEQPKLGNAFPILDVRETDAVLELPDGRAFVATFADGVNKDDAKRGMIATITSDGLDRSEAPKDAVISRIAEKDA